MNAYILIGGESRRMGRSKTELFFDRVSTVARDVFEDVFAVQRYAGPPASLPTIFERPHDDQAPVFGVAAALEHAGAKCFVLAVDYPLITAEILRYLRDRFERSAAHLVAPVWSGKTQMLCAGWSPALLPRMQERIAAKRYDLRGVAVEGEIIAEEELRARFGGEPLMNVNTVEELSRIRG